jgi:hypothetical protein
MGVQPESTIVEIDLVETDGATTLRLVHHGLPPESVEDHQRRWAYPAKVAVEPGRSLRPPQALRLAPDAATRINLCGEAW